MNNMLYIMDKRQNNKTLVPVMVYMALTLLNFSLYLSFVTCEPIDNRALLEFASGIKESGDREFAQKDYVKAMDYYDLASTKVEEAIDRDIDDGKQEDKDLIKLLASLYYQYCLVNDEKGDIKYARHACEFSIGTCLKSMVCPNYIEPFALNGKLSELAIDTLPNAIRDYNYVINNILGDDKEQYKNQLKVKIDNIKELMEDVTDYANLDHYELLKVPRTASSTDIENAYMEQVGKMNQLINRLPSDRSEEHKRKVQELISGTLIEAFSVLSDSERRSEYDAELIKED